MLNGIAPILIFQLYKRVPDPAATVATMPLSNGQTVKATFAIIPIYLQEELTGIYIDTESKNIDIETKTDSLITGAPGIINQHALASITTINMIAKTSSIGFTILLALAEAIIDKATSKECEVTYMHGAITVFGGLIHGFSYDQGSSDDLFKVKLELSRGQPKTKEVQVGKGSGVTLESQGATPPANAPTAPAKVGDGGRSVIQPNVYNGARP